ncbi:MAG: hypothetical protein R6U00_07140, partial [Prochlorococcaceae cyanobacterium]
AMAFSVTPWHGFLWGLDGRGHGVGVNHDPSLPRSPDRWVRDPGGALPFLAQGSRFVAPTLPVPINAPAPEIDTADDLALCRQLAPLLDRLDGASRLEITP